MTYIKHVVSKKKRRYIDNEFDLDLAYIKPNIIAMGFPSENLEGVYRNNFDDVVRFLEQKHKDKYKVYNLCSEKNYEPEKFNRRVSVFGFDDHSAPPFELMEQCCVDMDKWLNKDVENVAIVHCKAGKGRTGVMICAYLLYKGFYDNAKDAMEYYAVTRTENRKGVTIPSQRRYIEYFSYYLKNLKNKPVNDFERKTFLLKSITFLGIPTFNYGTCVPSFVVFSGKVELYKSKQSFEIKKSDKECIMQLQKPLPLCGDIKIDFFHKDLFKKERMFVFWFNTSFLEYNVTSKSCMKDIKIDNGILKKVLFSKDELDKANKDKKHKFFPENFKLSLDVLLPGNAKGDVVDGVNNKQNKQCVENVQSNGNTFKRIESTDKLHELSGNAKEDVVDSVDNKQNKQCVEKENGNKIERIESTDKLNEFSGNRNIVPVSPEKVIRTLSPPSQKRTSCSSDKGGSLTRSFSPSLDALAVDDALPVEEEQLSDDDEDEEQTTEI